MTFRHGLILAGALSGGLSACGGGAEESALSEIAEGKVTPAMVQEPAAGSASADSPASDAVPEQERVGFRVLIHGADESPQRSPESAVARPGVIVVTCSDESPTREHVHLAFRGVDGGALKPSHTLLLQMVPPDEQGLPVDGGEELNLLRMSEHDEKSHTIADSKKTEHLFAGSRAFPIRLMLRSTCLPVHPNDAPLSEHLCNVLADKGSMPGFTRGCASREIWFVLSHYDEHETPVAEDALCCTLAPFLLQSELNPPERIHTALIPDELIRSEIVENGVESVVVEDKRGNLGFVIDLLHIAEEAGVPQSGVVLTHPSSSMLCDQWAQDSHLFGYATGPGDATARYALRAFRYRSTQFLPSQEGHLTPGRASFSFPTSGLNQLNCCSQDYGGNFVVSPPIVAETGVRTVEESQSTTASQQNASYGKVIYGKAAGRNNSRGGPSRPTLDFFRVHNHQPLIPIDVSALKTGHADEVVSFIPAPSEGAGRWKMLVASTRLAHRLLYRLHQMRQRPDAWTILESWNDGHYVAEANDWSKSLRNFGIELNENIAADSEEFWLEANTENFVFAYDTLNRSREHLTHQIPVREEDTVDVPVLFTKGREEVSAVLPNMVNLQVLGNTLVVPKSFGPRVSLNVARELLVREGISENSLNSAVLAELTHDVMWMSREQAESLATQVAEFNVNMAHEHVRLAWRTVTGDDLPSPVRNLLSFSDSSVALTQTMENLGAGTWARVELTWLDSVPLFGAYLLAKMHPFGVRGRFIDDWVHYHSKGGDVHCGTCVSRSVPTVNLQEVWWK